MFLKARVVLDWCLVGPHYKIHNTKVSGKHISEHTSWLLCGNRISLWTFFSVHDIFAEFRDNRVPNDLEDREVWKNIKKSGLPLIVARIAVFPYMDAAMCLLERIEEDGQIRRVDNTVLMMIHIFLSKCFIFQHKVHHSHDYNGKLIDLCELFISMNIFGW